MLGGSCHEAEFCPLAPLLGVFDVDSSICHEGDFLGNAGLGWVTANKKRDPEGSRLS
jgi:hypothetical protein